MIGDFVVTTLVTAPPYYENAYLVLHKPSKEMVIIDPGSDGKRIVEHAKSAGGELKAIWLTHGHPDHIGGVFEIQQLTDLDCFAHADEKTVIDRVSSYSMALAGSSTRGPKSCEYFEGEPTLELGGEPVTAFYSPGHTPGGVCFIFDGFCITGDTLFNHGVGRTDLPGGNGRELSNSITRLLDTVPPATVLFSGHGPHWTAGEAKNWWGGVRF